MCFWLREGGDGGGNAFGQCLGKDGDQRGEQQERQKHQHQRDQQAADQRGFGSDGAEGFGGGIAGDQRQVRHGQSFGG